MIDLSFVLSIITLQYGATVWVTFKSLNKICFCYSSFILSDLALLTFLNSRVYAYFQDYFSFSIHHTSQSDFELSKKWNCSPLGRLRLLDVNSLKSAFFYITCIFQEYSHALYISHINGQIKGHRVSSQAQISLFSWKKKSDLEWSTEKYVKYHLKQYDDFCYSYSQTQLF